MIKYKAYFYFQIKINFDLKIIEVILDTSTTKNILCIYFFRNMFYKNKDIIIISKALWPCMRWTKIFISSGQSGQHFNKILLYSVCSRKYEQIFMHNHKNGLLITNSNTLCVKSTLFIQAFLYSTNIYFCGVIFFLF